jgi:hypothetical protein
MASSMLLVLAITGASTLFMQSKDSSSAATTRYNQQALVDTDLARVRRLNDRYTCFSGTCTSLGAAELGKNDFFPIPISSDLNGNSAAGNGFEALCNSTSLLTRLVTEIGATPPTLTAAGIIYAIDADNQGQQTVSEFGTNVVRNLHRYTITYTDINSGELLRRVTLVPTTVSWCP